MAEGARLASPVSGSEVLDSPEYEPGLVAVVDELHREQDNAVDEARRCCASACVSAEFARDGVEFGGEGHVGVAVREGSHVGKGGHVVALVVYRGVDSPFFDVDDDVVVGVVDDA